MIFDRLFKLMAERKASDLYVSAGTPIQIKINGVVVPINEQVMDPSTIQRMAYELLKPEQIARFELEREMNISYGSQNMGNFRINFFWQRSSISMVVRYIQGEIPSFNSLGLPLTLTEQIMKKHGLILVVGAAGTGKSTTIASLLDYRNTHRSGHILTVEDPIEYLFRHRRSVVNQREIGFDTHNFGEALRNAMRQAPDCIMIGEIRDTETMQAALSYAQSGHLCVATLHANNAYHALNRIASFFPLENRSLLFIDLSVALRCIISQRLVKQPSGERIPAAEVLLNNRHIGELIEKGQFSGIREAMENSLEQGSRTFEQDLARLFHEGKITMDEAMANADSATNLAWVINNTNKLSAEQEAAAKVSRGNKLDRQDDDGTSFSSFSLRVED